MNNYKPNFLGPNNGFVLNVRRYISKYRRYSKPPSCQKPFRHHLLVSKN